MSDLSATGTTPAPRPSPVAALAIGLVVSAIAIATMWRLPSPVPRPVREAHRAAPKPGPAPKPILRTIPARYKGKLVTRRVRRFPKKLLALTFDDGPDPEITPRILKTLEEHNAYATFFVRGDNAERHPQLLKQIAAGGHEIGNHSYSHETVSSEDAAKEELRKTDDAIGQVTGRDVRLFRPPKGIKNCELTRQALKAGYVVVLWTISSADSRPIAPEVIASNVIHTPNPGDIVIMHDGEGHTATADALPKVLDALEKKGYRFVTVPDLLGEWDRWLVRCTPAEPAMKKQRGRRV